MIRYFFALFTVTVVACSTSQLVREEVFIGETELSAMLPASIALHITGDLPTACHEFVAEIDGPDADKRIDVTIYSTISPAATCIQGLHSFDETIEIAMDGQPSGTYYVYLNDDLVGQIEFAGSLIE